MSTVSTQFTLPITSDLAILAAQDIADQRGWFVLSVSATEIVVRQKGGFNHYALTLAASFVEVDGQTRVGVNCRTIGFGPHMKGMVSGMMGQFVNSMSLRTQTSSLSINPTVQVGEGQGSPAAEPYDRYEQIKKAKELLDSGILTQEEFEAEKKRLLN